MKRKNSIKLLAVLLVCAMSFAFTAAAVPEKSAEGENSIYVMTDAQGKAEKLILTDTVIAALPESSGKGLPVNNPDGVKVDCGNQDDLMPIKMNISYTLDGKDIKPEKLAGQSGHVVIRYDYENLKQTKAKIQGSEKNIYVPFAVMTGMILDGEKFSNVTVSSGKVISDGKNYIAVGFAVPGLQESLNVKKSDVEFPSYLEFSADVKDFSLSMSVSMVSNELLKDMDIDLSANTADINKAIESLRSAMGQLEDGSSKLYEGLDTLLNSCVALEDGVSTLADGLAQLDANSAALQSGAQQVFNSLLSAANAQIEAAGLGNPGLTIDNFNQVLTALIDSLSESNISQQALDKVTAEVEKNHDAIAAGVTAEVQKAVTAKVEKQVVAAVKQNIEDTIRGDEAIMSQINAGVTESVKKAVTEAVNNEYHKAVLAAVLEKSEISLEEYEAMDSSDLRKQKIDAAVAQIMETKKDEIAQTVDAKMQSEEIQATIQKNVESKISSVVCEKLEEEQTKMLIAKKVEETVPGVMASDETKAIIDQYIAAKKQELISQAMASPEVKAQLEEALKAAGEGRESLAALLQSLNSYLSFYNGIWQYTNGVSAAAAGAGTLKSKMPELKTGVTQLKDGSQALKDGIKRFDTEGISPVTAMLDGELGALRDRLLALSDAANDYNPVSKLSKDAPLSYIYRSEAIG